MLTANCPADIAVHLARHGVKAQIERTVSAGLPVGEVLLSRAADLGVDLIAMGAYGHSRVRQMLLGGATRSVLRSMMARFDVALSGCDDR
jgi:nucleotide-binding universal stress UspA family protein